MGVLRPQALFSFKLSSFFSFSRVFDQSGAFSKRCFGRSVIERTVSSEINMPKKVDRSQLLNQRSVKHVLAADKSRPAADVCLQVLGNGSRGSPKCLFVFTDQWKYLFNCGEGTQRLAHEYKTKLAKLEHVFFTHRSWSNIGGLPGLILTIQGIGVPKVIFHGPSKIERLFDMTKGFMMTDDITIEKRNLDEGTHSDHIMTVKYVPFYGAKIVRSENWEGQIEDKAENESYYSHEKRSASNKDDADVSTTQANKRQKLCEEENDERDISVAYICKLSRKPGQLLLDKCLDFGVKPGPLLGLLKNGQDVTLENGTVVKACDVVSPEEPQPTFIVVECPSNDFLDSLLESEAFAPHQSSAECAEDMATLVVHFSPTEVVRTEKYQSWMRRFHPDTDHLMINDSNPGPTSRAVHRIQHKLNQLDTQIFPLLGETLLADDFVAELDGLKVLRGETMLKYHLRPLKRVDRTSVLTINSEEYIGELTSLPGFVKALSQLKSETEDVPIVPQGKLYPEIIFLGTGSSVPGKDRNTSGILLNLSSEKSMILDCGEGTFIQLLRFYGSKIDTVLRKIEAIYISHLHADHHIGLIEILKQRRRALMKSSDSEFRPVALMAPHPIMSWLSQYHLTFEPIIDTFSLYANGDFLLFNGNANKSKADEFIKLMDFAKVECVFVKHCKFAYGVAITHKDEWKLVYSGDTMPCDDLVLLGKDCDVLIHEATMEDDLEHEAYIKRHSTTTQAIEQGVKMKAKFTLLTHFSQRYAKIPLYNDNFDDTVGIVFDNTKLNLDNLTRLPRLLPALKEMFAEHYGNMQEKTAKVINQRKKDEIKVKENLATSN